MKAARSIPNPFCAEIQRDGYIIDVPRPPPPGRPITNPYYDLIQKGGGIHVGRPFKQEGRRPPTAVRSLRLPKKTWRRIEQQARREKLSVNAALHQAALIWLRS
jgi:hypothetical protein